MATIRQEMILLLSDKAHSARDLSQALRIPEKDVYDHLSHIARSVVPNRQELLIVPSRCLSCSYVFERRRRYTRPGRCPKCKSERIEDPTYRIA